MTTMVTVEWEMPSWGLAQAKAKLSDLVRQVETDGPQKISRSGREVAVVISIKDWQRMQPKGATPQPGVGTLHDLLMNSPLRGSGVDFPRLKGKVRDLER